MIELEKQDYPKARGSLKNVTINSLFARAVIERHISGTVYADNKDKPTTFYVVHPYGMSLLFGNHKNSEFNSAVKDYALNKNGSRNGFEWMQAFPNDWHNVIKELFKENLINSSENKNNLTAGFIELNTRVNFEFDLDKYFNFRENLNPTNGTITNTTKDIFNSMQGSVVPSNFWNNADDFLNSVSTKTTIFQKTTSASHKNVRGNSLPLPFLLTKFNENQRSPTQIADVQQY